jgi:short-subunit dehydrogenase
MPFTTARSPAALLGAGLLSGLALVRSRRRTSLRGSCALVTGGSRGLGLLVARELASRGARLVICARDEEELEAARRELERAGAEVLAVPCDVSDRGAVEQLMTAAEARFGRIDVLVNDASIIQVAPAEALSLEDLRQAMAVNFWGTVHCTLAVLPGMRARRSGRVVNITSVGGAVAVPHLLGYTSAKFAAVGFSTGLAAEVAQDGVLVTTVVPGLMRTGSFVHALVKGKRAQEASLFSLASSLPFLTLDASRAARRIVQACERGERFVTLGWPWKALRVAMALAPGVGVGVLALVSRLLPGAGGDRPESAAEPAGVHRRGAGHSVLTSLGEAAAAENNEQPVYRH